MVSTRASTKAKESDILDLDQSGKVLKPSRISKRKGDEYDQQAMRIKRERTRGAGENGSKTKNTTSNRSLVPRIPLSPATPQSSTPEPTESKDGEIKIELLSPRTSENEGEDEEEGEPEEGEAEEGEGKDEVVSDSQTPDIQNNSASADSKPKRKYRIDRNNIKINKRIMRKDTEEVIRMFKKFDSEVLTNPDAKSRLLALGFETRKRYITTFKHYIRFCCKKNLDTFLVTGELMREFYEDQFSKSSSDKPVIRLRKMDPAFSKLQEINFLVYGLKNREIPNRSIAVDYLIFKDTGSYPEPKKSLPAPKRSEERRAEMKEDLEHCESVDSSRAPDSKSRKRTVNKNEFVTFIKSSFKVLRSQVDESVHKTARKMYDYNPELAYELVGALQRQINEQMDKFQFDLVEGPMEDDDVEMKTEKTESEVVREVARGLMQGLVQNQESAQQFPSHPLQYSTQPKQDEAQIPVQPSTQPQELVIESNTGLPALSDATESETASHNLAPLIQINHDIFTIYEILEEWYTVIPSIEKRVAKWGVEWIKDKIDHQIYMERKLIVEFVERISLACKLDKYIVANECDGYIRDESTLDEFISEIELSTEELFNRFLRYRKRRT